VKYLVTSQVSLLPLRFLETKDFLVLDSVLQYHTIEMKGQKTTLESNISAPCACEGGLAVIRNLLVYERFQEDCPKGPNKDVPRCVWFR
jgi:hypothetical protein